MDHVSTKNPDVLITGAGPTGLMMACQLSFFDVSFRLIDKKQTPSSQSGAMIIHSSTLEMFRQMGLVEEMLKQGTVISSLSVSFNGNEARRLVLSGKGSKLSGFPFSLMLEQSKTERLLIDFLEQKGHGVEWETELMDVVQAEHEVKAVVLSPEGIPEEITTKYLVAADGGKSKVRNLLHIPFEGKTHGPRLSVMECDADMSLSAGEIFFSFSKQATTGFFPLPGGKWRIDAALRRMKNKNHPLTFERVQNAFNRKTKLPANIRNPEWFSVFHSHGRYSNHFRINRCFLAGDAAHLFTPVGGQGMNTGLQDSCNLAWKLAMVLQRRIVPEILETYETERKPVAIKTCRSSDLFFMLAASGKLHHSLFRNVFMPPLLKLFYRLMDFEVVANNVFRKISGVGITYDFNMLNRDVSRELFSTAPKPGQRLPFVQYRENDKVVTLHEKIRCNRFLLFIFGDRNNADILSNAIKGYHDILIPVIIPFNKGTSDVYLHFGIKTEGWYLVRPDMHIACRSDEPGAEELTAYLHTLFTRHEERK